MNLFNSRPMRYILASLMSVLVMLTGCDTSNKQDKPAKPEPTKLIIKEPNDLKICKSDDCVDSYRATRDLFSTSVAAPLVNPTAGVLAGRFIYAIPAAIKYTQEGVDYAIYFVQLNQVSEYQDCHTCQTIMAAVIYQYQNDGWRLFAGERTVEIMGRYGRAFFEPEKNIKIQRRPDEGKEAFVISIDLHDFGQGHSASTRYFISVNRGSTDTLGKIVSLGSIQTAASDCATGNSTEPSWESSTKWVRGNPGKFDIELTKHFRKSCTDETIGSEKTVIYENLWNTKEKEYYFAPKLGI